ncbi:MAG: hypothetical protein J6W33_01610 [Spirochaetia bacterium]|nr:hypothetical protein [Spirochaetia bacterium]
MKGSIRFDNDINIEVDVDKSAEEGAKLTSAVNLVDGQELGGANYSEVFEGNGNAIFGDEGLSGYSDEDQFISDIKNDNIYIVIDFDLTALTGVHIILPVSCDIDTPIATNITISADATTVDGVSAGFGIVGGEQFNLNVGFLAGVLNGVITDITSYAATIPTRTTVYYHPMP